MAKTKKNDILVRITKGKTNFELRYDFFPMLTEFIKKFPREHTSVKVETFTTGNGGTQSVWVRYVSPFKIGDVISFLMDNSIKFQFENVTSDVVKKLQEDYKDRNIRIKQAITLKDGQLEIGNEDYSYFKIQPYDYQKRAIKFFEINNGIAILGDSPGVGKSLSALGYAYKHKLKTLVICPASLKLNWKKEVLKFTGEKTFIFKYKPNKKSKDTFFSKNESLFHVINFESISSYIKFEYNHTCKGRLLGPDGKTIKCNWTSIDLDKSHSHCPVCNNKGSVSSSVKGLVFVSDEFKEVLEPFEYDLVIIDECHRIKEDKTTWTKLIKSSFTGIPKKILLSGTVIKSKPIEFFSTLNFINPLEWKDRHLFGVRYCAGFESNFGWDFNGASNLEELFKRVSSVFLRRLKSDVLKELPPKTYVEIPIELTDKEWREYRKLEEDAINSIDDPDSSDEVKKETFLTKIHRLKRFTGMVKATRAKEFIEDYISAGEKIVVFSDYQDVSDKVYSDFEDVSVKHNGKMNMSEKEESVERFQNDDSVKVFSGMMLASGVGITLTAASNLMKIGFAWSPGDEEQAEDRIHRASSTAERITIITLYCPGTIDDDIIELLKKKSQVVSKTLDNKNFNKNSTEYSSSIFSDLVKKLKEKRN